MHWLVLLHPVARRVVPPEEAVEVRGLHQKIQIHLCPALPAEDRGHEACREHPCLRLAPKKRVHAVRALHRVSVSAYLSVPDLLPGIRLGCVCVCVSCVGAG